MGRSIAGILDLVTTLWPGVDVDAAVVHHGLSHDMIVVPGTMAVRVARTPEGEDELRRCAPLLSNLAGAGLPFAVPQPLSPVMYHGGMAALATTVVPGRPRPASDPPPTDPGLPRLLLQAIAGVPVTGLASTLTGPRAPAGGPSWADDAGRYLLPLLSPAQAHLVEARIDAALDVREPTRPGLVHGDLAGTNLHWDGDRIVGVLDWDRAFTGDPAYDVAGLADTFGWATLTSAVGESATGRARRYRDVLLVESYLAALRHGAVDDAAKILNIIRGRLDNGTISPPTPA